MPRQTAGAVTAMEMVEGVLDWALRLAGVALIAITLYYIYGTVFHADQLFGGAAAGGGPMSVAAFQQHLQNMELLTKLLLVATVVLTLAALGRYPGQPETGMLLLLFGALLFFGMPFLIDSMGSSSAGLPRNLLRIGDPRAYLKGRYVIAGLVLMGSGGLHLLAHGFLRVVAGKQRRPRPNEEAARTAAQVRRPNDRFLGPCWDLPFCRDTEKKLCPIRQSKKPCWRGGRGCYCDQNVILTLSGGNVYQASRGVSGYLSSTATMVRPKTLSEKRAQCLQCPVYLHHQSQKYRLLAPLAVAGVLGAVAFWWPVVKNLYPEAMRAVGRALAGFSFGPSAGGVPGWAAELAANSGIMWLFVIVGCMLAIAYLLHGIEWVLYRLGI